MNFPLFMSSAAGRLIRILAGMGLAWWGYSLSSTFGWVIAVIGIVVLAAGIFNFCIFAPLFGMPLKGSEIRSKN